MAQPTGWGRAPEKRLETVIARLDVRGSLAPAWQTTLPHKILHAGRERSVASGFHADLCGEILDELERCASERDFWTVLTQRGIVDEAEAIEAERVAIECRRRRLYERVRSLLGQYQLAGVDRDAAAEDLAREAEEDGEEERLVRELRRHAGGDWAALRCVLHAYGWPRVCIEDYIASWACQATG